MIQNIRSSEELKAAILMLEIKQAEEGILLKNQFHATLESLKPINAIKRTLRDLTSSSDTKSGLLNGLMGLVAGIFSKKILVGKTRHNPIKKILGVIVEMAIGGLVANNSEVIKSTGKQLLGKFFHNGHAKEEV